MTIINDSIPDPDTAATLQACRLALSIAQGEWSFDPDEGIPYATDVLVKAPNLDRIRALVRRQLLAVTPGVDVLLNDDGDLAIVNGDLAFGRAEAIVAVDVDASFDRQLRKLSINFVAYTASGQTVRDSVGV